MDKPRQPFPDKTSPLIPISAFFILGIIAASYNWFTNRLSLAFLIVSLLVLILGIKRKWRHNLTTAYIAFFLIGAILASQQANPYFPKNHIKVLSEHYNNLKRDEPGIRVEGVLANPPERFSDKTRLYIDAKKIFTQKENIPVTGKILITVESTSVKFKYSDRLRFILKPRIPQNFGNPGEDDYAGNLARQDIYVTGYIENERWIAVMGGEEKHGLRTSIEQVRDKIRDFIDGSSIENSAIIKALIIGEEDGISQKTRSSFNITATTHILSISGLHIGIVAFAAYWVTFQLLRLSERLTLAVNIRKLAAVSGIIPVLLYGA